MWHSIFLGCSAFFWCYMRIYKFLKWTFRNRWNVENFKSYSSLNRIVYLRNNLYRKFVYLNTPTGGTRRVDRDCCIRFINDISEAYVIVVKFFLQTLDIFLVVPEQEARNSSSSDLKRRYKNYGDIFISSFYKKQSVKPIYVYFLFEWC